MLMKHFFEYIVSFLVVLSTPALAAVWYADKDAPPGGDGTSWATALTEIQPAIDAAYTDGGGEVWIAEGRYDELRTGYGGSLVLQPGTAVYGGFQGHETELAMRNPRQYSTVIDGSKSWDGKNAYIVIDSKSDTVLDGITLEAGSLAQIGICT